MAFVVIIIIIIIVIAVITLETYALCILSSHPENEFFFFGSSFFKIFDLRSLFQYDLLLHRWIIELPSVVLKGERIILQRAGSLVMSKLIIVIIITIIFLLNSQFKTLIIWYNSTRFFFFFKFFVLI